MHATFEPQHIKNVVIKKKQAKRLLGGQNVGQVAGVAGPALRPARREGRTLKSIDSSSHVVQHTVLLLMHQRAAVLQRLPG